MTGLAPQAPPLDKDDDGMPDAWERTNGLNPEDGSDCNTIMASGYTAIEEYCNVLAQELIEHRGNLPVKGDLDQDSKTGIFDLIKMLKALSEDQNCTADMNYDGRVNIFDMLELIRAMVSRR